MFGAADNQSGGMTNNPLNGVGTPYTPPAPDPVATTAPPVDESPTYDSPMPSDAPAVDAHMQPAYNYDGPSEGASTSPPSMPEPMSSPDPSFTPVDDASASAGPAPDAPSNPVNHDELMNLKEEALQHLGPMMGQLEQAPEEKFKTLMMMIQASDDHTKLKDAFEIAKLIEDDKVRAQALLDIINEINYFTQQPASNPNPSM